MKVRASKIDDYVFDVAPFEWSAIKNSSFGASILGNGASILSIGATFSVYSEIPDRMIKGETFQEIETPQSRAVVSKTDFLTAHGLCVWVATGEIIEISNMLENVALSIEPDHYRYVCNHIPQIFYPSPFGVIVGIDGEYDFNTGQFKGSLIFE
ncbi:hypothetical protein P7245_22345 [Vibrio parahaemolyticus]|nr:hypothetical protein [Vibrio parahaemolyticus]